MRGALWKVLMLLAAPFRSDGRQRLGGPCGPAPAVLSTERIKPNFSKLSLIGGLKRMFGIEGLMKSSKGC